MPQDISVLRCETAQQEFIEKICRLTQEDQIRWAYAFDGTDCEYMTQHAGAMFRLGCHPRSQRFMVDGDKIDIGDDAISILCNEIAKQRSRLRSIAQAEKLERLNKLLG